jgi:hypothetical protein
MASAAPPAPTGVPEAPAPPDPGALSSALCEELGETEADLRHLVKRLIKRIGWPILAEALQDTRDIEDSGGLWSVQDKRRRTKGGTFFALMKDRSVEARWMLFHLQALRRQKAEKLAALAEPPFTWEHRGDLIRELLPHQGQAMTAKLTLIGRPEKVVQRQDFVITALEYRGSPSLPKGLPIPKSTRTTYTVYIAAKQWRKVAEPLKNAEDQLIVEGFCMHDPEAGGIAVFAQSVTTKALQRQKLVEAQKAPPAGAGGGEPAAPSAPAPSAVASEPSPLPAPPAPPTEEDQIRALLKQILAGGQTLESLAGRTGLPLRPLNDIHNGRPTTLTPAQVRTLLQKLRQANR